MSFPLECVDGLASMIPDCAWLATWMQSSFDASAVMEVKAVGVVGAVCRRHFDLDAGTADSTGEPAEAVLPVGEDVPDAGAKG